jgi:cytidylate kinase
MIITIGRECGSGGHQIGEKLAAHYGLKLYDRHILVAEAKRTGKYDELEAFFSERPMDSLLYSIAVSEGRSKAGERTLERFKGFLQEESFVMIGRCGNYLYKDESDATSVFIHADEELRIQRTVTKQHLDRIKAAELIKYVDEKRQDFHSRYTNQNWGDSRNYQLTLDSGTIGIDATVDIIIDFINKKNATRQ